MLERGVKYVQNLTKKTPEGGHSGVFIVNFEHIMQIFQVFLLLTLNR